MTARRRATGPPQRVGTLVPAVLRDLGLAESARAVRIHERWEQAVGPEVAAHCQPLALRDVELDIKYLLGKNFHRGDDVELGPSEIASY